MGWNYFIMPKLQQLHRWSLEMDKKFHPTLYWVCDYLSTLRLKLIHVSKRGPWCAQNCFDESCLFFHSEVFIFHYKHKLSWDCLILIMGISILMTSSYLNNPSLFHNGHWSMLWKPTTWTFANAWVRGFSDVVATFNHSGRSFNLFYGNHWGCLNNPIFFNLGLCDACWAHFMCHHKLWPTWVSHTFSFLNSSVDFAGGKQYQKIVIPIYSDSFFKILLFQAVFLLYSLVSLLSLLILSFGCIVIAVNGSMSVQGTS